MSGSTGENTDITEESPVDAPVMISWKEPIAQRALDASDMRGVVIAPGVAVRLSATAIDPEDGNVGASVIWHSSLMGVIGTGPSRSVQQLIEADEHAVTSAAATGWFTALAIVAAALALLTRRTLIGLVKASASV